jgi:hypothetical protein
LTPDWTTSYSGLDDIILRIGRDNTPDWTI